MRLNFTGYPKSKFLTQATNGTERIMKMMKNLRGIREKWPKEGRGNYDAVHCIVKER